MKEQHWVPKRGRYKLVSSTPMCLGLSFLFRLFQAIYKAFRIFLYLINYKINKLLGICILFLLPYNMLVSVFRLLFYIVKIYDQSIPASCRASRKNRSSTSRYSTRANFCYELIHFEVDNSRIVICSSHMGFASHFFFNSILISYIASCF